jgi:heterotetrameric sarcosine oxidase gamma subunit
MHDRGQFWLPVPDWERVSLHAAGVDANPVTVASICLVSGDLQQLLARHGIGEILGPRQLCSGDTYALRLAPDRVMFVGDATVLETCTGSTNSCAVTDVSDGIMIFDIHGERAADLMAQGSEYPFEDTAVFPHESASMQFAGFRLAVARRPDGWRLHIERSWAPALWHWLQAHVEASECSVP